ncbi:MAG: hypothetical protein AAGI53_00910 [Planctomycetota bacterium]
MTESIRDLTVRFVAYCVKDAWDDDNDPIAESTDTTIARVYAELLSNGSELFATLTDSQAADVIWGAFGSATGHVSSLLQPASLASGPLLEQLSTFYVREVPRLEASFSCVDDKLFTAIYMLGDMNSGLFDHIVSDRPDLQELTRDAIESAIWKSGSVWSHESILHALYELYPRWDRRTDEACAEYIEQVLTRASNDTSLPPNLRTAAYGVLQGIHP